MSYMALYREWRPRLFRDIIGQEHITRTLVNALERGRVAHAYLFCGPRGTGKTTTAKVLAKALNCSQRRQAEPCDGCSSCADVNAGVSMDVMEIDAASNRGIDEIRDLREKVKFMPSGGNYRVYIIDEVHMLTNEAFNALLKTLEEPPRHVVFVLATTEPHKVPLTILSRCQRFDFGRIAQADMLRRLEEVAGQADISADKDALVLIARAAEGGLRDALSMLDQASAFGGGRVTVADVHHILGTVHADVLERAARAICDRQPGEALKLVSQLSGEGKDLRLFLRELAAYLRDIMLAQLCPGDGISGDERSNPGLPFETDRLLQVLHILSRVEQDMRFSTQPGILLELALVRAARAGDFEPGDLLKRIQDLEYRLELVSSGAARNAAPNAGGGNDNSKNKAVLKHKGAGSGGGPGERVAAVEEAGDVKGAEKKTGGRSKGVAAAAPAKGVAEPGGGAEDGLELINSHWDEIVEGARKFKDLTHFKLAGGWPLEAAGNTVTIAFPPEEEFSKLYLEDPRRRESLEGIISTYMRKNCRLRFVINSNPPPREKKKRPDQDLNAQRAMALFGAEEVEAHDAGDVPDFEE